MEGSHMCVLTLLVIAAVTSSLAATSNSQEGHEGHPHSDHQAPPPAHAAIGDKPAQPIAPRDGGIGQIPCTIDYNCTSSPMGEYSQCHGSICSCTAGSTPSQTTQQCLRESKLGSGCAEDWQCTRPLGNNVACINHICSCVSGAQLLNNKCWVQKKLSDPCQAAEECLAGKNTECKDSRCACKPGMVPNSSNDKCIPVAINYQDSCEEDIQCTQPFGSGSDCSSNKCVCQDGYHFKNHVCMKNAIVNDPCGPKIGDCFLIHDLGVDHVECVQGTCKCKGDRTPSDDKQKCLNPGQTDTGSGGGAESVQPLMITFATMVLARLLLS